MEKVNACIKIVAPCLPAVTCSICLVPALENFDDDSKEDAEEVPLERTGFLDKSTAPVGNFYLSHQGSGVYINDDDEPHKSDSSYHGASPPETSAGTMDSPTLSVQCRKGSFHIVLHAGGPSDVQVKGTCRGAIIQVVPHPSK